MTISNRRAALGAVGLAVAVVISLIVVSAPDRADAAQARALAAAAAQGLTCTQTMKADNIGFVLDCSAAVAPSPSPTVSASPSPTVSPSPTPAQQNGCQANPGACGFPDAATTGPSGSLPVWTGSRTFSMAGQVVANATINGCVEVRADNVTFRNVAFNANGCFWGVNNFATGLQVIDSSLTCGGFNGTGFGSARLSLLRVEISRCENGLNVSGNVSVVDSWIHDMNGGAGGAHTDGAQFNQGASDILFQHNTINVGPANGATSAIIMWDEGGAQNARVTIANNLLAGGTYTLYCGREGAVDNVRITGNRFGTFEFGYANACNSGEVWTANVRDRDGATLSAT